MSESLSGAITAEEPVKSLQRERKRERVGLGQMYRAGFRSLRRHPLLAVAVYGVQLVLSGAAAWMMARVLADHFAHYPLFDRAVDGDTFSLGMVMVTHPEVFSTLIWIGLAATLVYGMISWFLTAGLITVYTKRPTDRLTTAEVFGAGGAARFFAFARLAAWNAAPKLLGGVLVLMSLGFAVDDMTDTLTLSELISKAIVGAIPGLVVLWIAGTAGAYARVDLVNYPKQSSLRALFRGYKTIATNWRPMIHAASYWAFFVVVSLAFVAATYDVAVSAIAILIVRQAVTIMRYAGTLVLIGGQVELGGGMSAPRPRRLRRRHG